MKFLEILGRMDGFQWVFWMMRVNWWGGFLCGVMVGGDRGDRDQGWECRVGRWEWVGCRGVWGSVGMDSGDWIGELIDGFW